MMPAALQVQMNDSPELYVVRVLFTSFCNGYFCMVNSYQQLAYGGTPELVLLQISIREPNGSILFPNGRDPRSRSWLNNR